MINDYLKGLKKTSKKTDVPGTVEAVLDEICHICNVPLKKYKPCCGYSYGYKGCNKCGLKVPIPGDSV